MAQGSKQDDDGGRARAALLVELSLAGLSQSELRRLLGVTAVTVNRWCRLRADGKPVPKYARAFLKLWHMAPGPARAVMLNDSRRSVTR